MWSCLPGDANVRDLLPLAVVDQRQSKVLQQNFYFLIGLFKLLSLTSLCHHSNVLSKYQHPLASVQEGSPVDLRLAVVGKLTKIILNEHRQTVKKLMFVFWVSWSLGEANTRSILLLLYPPATETLKVIRNICTQGIYISKRSLSSPDFSTIRCLVARVVASWWPNNQGNN